MPEQRKTLGEMVLDGSDISDRMVFAVVPQFESDRHAGEFYTVRGFGREGNYISRTFYRLGKGGLHSREVSEEIFPTHFKDLYMPELSVEDAEAIMYARLKKEKEAESKPRVSGKRRGSIPAYEGD